MLASSICSRRGTLGRAGHLTAPSPKGPPSPLTWKYRPSERSEELAHHESMVRQGHATSLWTPPLVFASLEVYRKG